MMRGRSHRWFAALLAAGITLLFVAFGGNAYQALEHYAYDAPLPWLEQTAPESRVVLVDIDEASLAEIGPWPWPRDTLARLLEQLNQHYHAVSVGVDVLFASPGTEAGDLALRKAAAQPGIILSQVFDLTPDSPNQSGQLEGAIPYTGDSRSLPAAQGYIANTASILPEAAQVGHISPLLDEDGRVRRMHPLICRETECYAALALRMYMQLFQAERLAIIAHTPAHGVQLALSVPGATRMTLDARQALLIPYRTPPSGFQAFSAADVLLGRVPPALLSQRLVLVGSTALGMGDRIATPQQSMASGLEIHAQLLTALLDDRLWVAMPPLAGAMQCLVALLGVVLFVYWPWRGPWASVIWSMGLGGSAFAVILAARLQGWVLAATPVPLFALATLLFSLLLESDRMNRRVRGLARQFGRFIPDSIVTRVLSDQEVKPGSERKTLSVLVADMRGFTRASEHCSPEQVADLAQHCLEAMSAVVGQHGGIIEKFTGDGLMAIWGPPLTDAEHATRAVMAAKAMQQAITDLAPWFRSQGFDALKVSIGINTGEMAVGIFGGAAHQMWSAHGDAVNLASRIEQLTRVTGDDLLIGPLTAALLGRQNCFSRGQHKVKGRTESVEVYSVP